MQKALILGLFLFATPIVFADHSRANRLKDLKTIPLTAPEIICEKPHPVLFGSLDFTYWIGRAGGVRTFNRWLFSTTIGNPPTQDFFPETSRQPGFKIALGGYLKDLNWEMLAQYTFFYNGRGPKKLEKHTTDPDLYDENTIGNSYANVFNRVDLVLRKRISSGEFISVNPFSGLLVGWDDQWWKDYTIKTTIPSAHPAYNYLIQQKWKGIGPYMGFNGLLYLPIGFLVPSGQLGFYLDGGIALPLSYYQVTQVNDKTDEGTHERSPNNWIAKFWMLSSMFESSIGLHWITLYGPQCANTFSLKLGWEEQFWYKHSYFNNAHITAGAENYLMHGLTFRVQMEY